MRIFKKSLPWEGGFPLPHPPPLGRFAPSHISSKPPVAPPKTFTLEPRLSRRSKFRRSNCRRSKFRRSFCRGAIIVAFSGAIVAGAIIAGALCRITLLLKSSRSVVHYYWKNLLINLILLEYALYYIILLHHPSIYYANLCIHSTQKLRYQLKISFPKPDKSTFGTSEKNWFL